MAPSSRVTGRHQLGPLTRAFVARFFDNEITGGSNDLKASFFWLIAFLAPLGIFMPWSMIFQYQVMVIEGGTELLRRASMADKTLYLGLGMAAAGGLGIVTWHALLMDRRDALVLGVLPLRGATIVGAKLAALVIYVGLVTVGMHVGASVSFGVILGAWQPVGFAVRGIAAHFVASCLASAFMLLSITAAQGIVTLAAGPRAAARVSPALQLGATVLVGGLLLVLPTLSTSVVEAVHPAAPVTSWVLSTPPVWFLGLYESVLGTRDPVLRHLAVVALSSVAAVAIVTMAVYPLAYRRVMVAAVEGRDVRRGHGPSLHRWIERGVTASPVARAAVQFMLATITRVERHRFVLAMSGGVVAAVVLPSASALLRAFPVLPPLPSVGILSAPVAAMLVSLVAVRLAASLPADLKAGWIFPVIGSGDGHGRSALRRLLFLFGIVPTAGTSLALVCVAWGARLGLTYGVLCLAAGLLVTEALLRGFTGLPCARPWRPEGANLRVWWPGYAAAFLLLMQGIPRLTLAARDSPAWLVVSVTPLAAGALALHVRGRRDAGGDEEDAEESTAVQITGRE